VTPTSAAPLTLHEVATAAEVRRLGDRMHNCLGGYGGKLGGVHRIVEVRRGGRTVYAVHVERGRIVTFEAPGNRRPDPADVPVVRRLLERSGLLAATATYVSPSQRAGTEPLDGQGTARTTDPPGQPRLPLEPRSQRRAVPPRRHVPDRPAPPPGVSLQQLATEYLGPATLQSPDWTEVAAVLWAVGLLPRLPDPEQASFARVVRDLAGRVAIGEDATLGRRPAPSAEEQRAARRALLDRATPDEPNAWRLRRMAAVLEVPLRP
jgi:hypothetical protein